MPFDKCIQGAGECKNVEHTSLQFQFFQQTPSFSINGNLVYSHGLEYQSKGKTGLLLLSKVVGLLLDTTTSVPPKFNGWILLHTIISQTKELALSQ